MEHQMMPTFLLFCLVTSRCFESTPPNLTAANRGMTGTTVSAHRDEADSLVLPDGTALYVKVAKGFSSGNSKMGDIVDCG